MPRAGLFLAVIVALLAAVPAGAELRPVQRDFGEVHVPRVRPGKIVMRRAHERGRVRVIVQLSQPPLAQSGRELQGTSGRRKLSVTSASSRGYLAELAAAQRAAVAQLERAIPEASVSRRYRIVFNGLAVEVPVRRLPELVRQRFARKVYPSLRYSLALNQSPAVIDARALEASTGAKGEGMKIAVVDDGVDPANPFFDPSRFSYPAGFPKGARQWTTPKVIVARAFPAPGTDHRARIAVDPRESFHGTHVAGIAAGVEGTTAPEGGDHPEVPGLSGVAPRAWIGNYRVFSLPSPVGNVANTPEIVAAFEAAVADGMDVINFSGGGTPSEPANDALVEVVRNVAAAGVVPVISAGNDRDEFGFGTVGSPGSAPEAIAVAASSNSQVFSPALDLVAPDTPATLDQIPFRSGDTIPDGWTESDQTIVDVGSLVGTDGRPVDRLLCGPEGNPNGGAGTLRSGSLAGAIALASRGTCTFASKALRARAAGAIGLVLVDNRAGEADPIPIRLAVPAAMIADLDGARLRDFLAARGGRTAIRFGNVTLRIETGRGSVVARFSAGGPTAFGHDLKPDLTAPGSQILSATLPGAGGPFAVFDGTSMAAPHVAGAAAVLLQRHPGWTPRQVKSALVSTAGTVWADTARSLEASVLLGGGGLVDLGGADDPRVFTDPVSLSFPDLNANSGSRSEALLMRVTDAGGGAGTWQVELRPQAATAGASLELPPMVTLSPGGETHLVAVARAAAGAAAGENYGFILLRQGDVVRRLPYFFLVIRPALESVQALPLRRFQTGTTVGESRIGRYGYPTAPFGPAPSYVGPPMDESGVERLYVTQIDRPVANFGVVVIAGSAGSSVDPWVLGSRDENDVQGAAGTPVNANNLTFGYRTNIGAAGAALPRPGRYFVSVDSGTDPFTGRSLAGRYVLQSWVNDVAPPLILPITTRVSAGFPTLVVRVLDGLFRPESGVDPISLAIGYRGVLIGAAAYDPLSGIAIFPLPRGARSVVELDELGTTQANVIASDYQEAKNVASISDDLLPNTSFIQFPLRVVPGPAVTWLAPEARQCVARRASVGLLVVASARRGVAQVRFLDGDGPIATRERGTAGLFSATWRVPARARGGVHRLHAVTVDRQGRRATAVRPVRVCG